MHRTAPSQLTPEDLEALRRLSAAGAEQAVWAISVLTGIEVRSSDPGVRWIRIDEVPSLLGGGEATVVALHMEITGQARGSILIALEPECAGRLLDAICPGRVPGLPVSPGDLPALERSGLLETGNILGAAYLTAVSDMARVHFIPSVPHLAVDMAGALVDYLVVEQTEGRDSALLVDTRMQDEAGALRARILMLPDPGTLPAILQAIRLRGV